MAVEDSGESVMAKRVPWSDRWMAALLLVCIVVVFPLALVGAVIEEIGDRRDRARQRPA